MVRGRIANLSAAIVVAGLALALLARQGMGQNITWGGANNITGASDVSTAGTGVYALDWNGTASTITVNGVGFMGQTSRTSGNAYLTNNFASPGTTNGVGQGPASYNGILYGNVYTDGGASASISLLGLTASHQYQVQYWTEDPRTCCGARIESLNGLNSVQLHQNTNGAGLTGLGQFALGYFTPSATSESFTVTSIASNNAGDVAITAIQVRDVTGTWSGQTDGTWSSTDGTSQNFSGLSFTGVTGLVNNVFFGDITAQGTAVSTGTVAIQAGGVSIGNVFFQNNKVPYTLTSADSNGITGASAVTVSGTGLVTFAGANSYTGLTAINGGTLAFANNAALAGGGPIAFGGGALAFSPGFTPDVSAQILSSTGAIAINTGGQSVTFNSGLASSNAAGLTVLGGGLLSLAGSNLYTGTTTISSGTLAISGGGLLGANGNSSSPIVNNGLLAVNTSSNQTFSGAISGTGSFQQLGSNVTTLSSANTFTGTTRVTGGTLRREPNWRVN